MSVRVWRRSSNKAWARPSGTSCPLHAAQTAAGWQTGSWFLPQRNVVTYPAIHPSGIDCRSITALGRYRRLSFIHAPDPSRSFPTLPRHAIFAGSSATRCRACAAGPIG